jgi:hypothetical protein
MHKKLQNSHQEKLLSLGDWNGWKGYIMLVPSINCGMLPNDCAPSKTACWLWPPAQTKYLG